MERRTFTEVALGLLLMPAAAPCGCDDGLVCENHPHLPMNHDEDCGAGAPCLNPRCPHGRRWLRWLH